MTPRHRLAAALVCGLVLAVATESARGQAPVLPQRLGAGARAAVERIIDSARTMGLPTAPLADKAAEGVLKGAPDERIVMAVRGLARDLGQARSILGADAGVALLGATASALRAGAPAAELRRLAHPADGRDPDPDALAAALVTLVDLVAKHIDAPTATDAVSQLLQRRALDRDFMQLRNDVEQDIRSGTAPDVALSNRTRARVRVLDAAPLDRRAPARPPAP